jgi:hypothetical protein
MLGKKRKTRKPSFPLSHTSRRPSSSSSSNDWFYHYAIAESLSDNDRSCGGDYDRSDSYSSSSDSYSSDSGSYDW